MFSAVKSYCSQIFERIELIISFAVQRVRKKGGNIPSSIEFTFFDALFIESVFRIGSKILYRVSCMRYIYIYIYISKMPMIFHNIKRMRANPYNVISSPLDQRGGMLFNFVSNP